jgi:hypothetical protein
MGEKASRFEQLRENLREVYDAVFPVYGACRLFREAEIGDPADHPEAMVPKQNLAEPLRRFKDQPDWMLDQRNFSFATFRNIVKELCEAVDRELKSFWDEYTSRKVPPISREELDVFADDPKLRDKVRTIRDTVSAVLQLSDRLPRDKDQLRRFEDKVDELTRAWKSLTEAAGGHAPPEVIRFLQRAGTVEGAPLTLLTRTVIEWLDQNGRTGRYVVKSVGFAQTRM